MIVEPGELRAQRVAALVLDEWGLVTGFAEHVPIGSEACHWVLGDDGGPQWFATAHPVPTEHARATRVACYVAALQVAQRSSYAVTPVPSRDGRPAVDAGPHWLLTVAPYLEGHPVGADGFPDDDIRADVAGMVGDLHRQSRPRHLPAWRPQLGRDAAAAEALGRLLTEPAWRGGPWALPAQRLVSDAGPAVRQALRRYRMLASAVAGSVDRWVPTHGRARGEHVVQTPDGPRLVSWGRLALAPRERDLCDVLGGAAGDEPWYAYLAAGGRVDPLSRDACEMFGLERRLSAVADHALRLAGEHTDAPDEARRFAELEAELVGLQEQTG